MCYYHVVPTYFRIIKENACAFNLSAKSFIPFWYGGCRRNLKMCVSYVINVVLKTIVPKGNFLSIYYLALRF